MHYNWGDAYVFWSGMELHFMMKLHCIISAVGLEEPVVSSAFFATRKLSWFCAFNKFHIGARISK